MGKKIIVVATLDSKGEEALYLQELIKDRGHDALLMDIGIGGEVSFRPDFTREEVALATGRRLEEIRKGARTHTEVLTAVATGAKANPETGRRQGDRWAAHHRGRPWYHPGFHYHTGPAPHPPQTDPFNGRLCPGGNEPGYGERRPGHDSVCRRFVGSQRDYENRAGEGGRRDMRDGGRAEREGAA
jgi:hypothetical protein